MSVQKDYLYLESMHELLIKQNSVKQAWQAITSNVSALKNISEKIVKVHQRTQKLHERNQSIEQRMQPPQQYGKKLDLWR